jgi:hypothetical protein
MIKTVIFTLFLLSYGDTDGLKCYKCGFKYLGKPCSSSVTANEIIDCSFLDGFSLYNLTGKVTCVVSYY